MKNWSNCNFTCLALAARLTQRAPPFTARFRIQPFFVSPKISGIFPEFWRDEKPKLSIFLTFFWGLSLVPTPAQEPQPGRVMSISWGVTYVTIGSHTVEGSHTLIKLDCGLEKRGVVQVWFVGLDVMLCKRTWLICTQSSWCLVVKGPLVTPWHISDTSFDNLSQQNSPFWYQKQVHFNNRMNERRSLWRINDFVGLYFAHTWWKWMWTLRRLEYREWYICQFSEFIRLKSQNWLVFNWGVLRLQR